jgi:hypothetical protein
LNAGHCAGRAIRTFFNAVVLQILCLPLAYVYTVLEAPPVLRTLFYADLFSWIGIMAHGMFYTGDSFSFITDLSNIH